MTDPSFRWRQPGVMPVTGVSLPPGMPPIRCLFQPIVDLSTQHVVGFEALTRGIDDTTDAGNSDALFEWARRTGRLRELDWACRMTAMSTALQLQMRPGCGLFVNVEPAALGGESPYGFDELVAEVRESGVAVVIEFTERALADNTSSLLRLGDWVRDQGWSIAIDDIGADPGSLALVPLLKPEIIKLDLRLIQARTTVDVAQIVNAVNAEAGRTGALVLAEGIETERHAALAVSMGAHLGQGWFFGRPAAEPSMDTDSLPAIAERPVAEELPDAPWDLVAESPKVRRAEKVLLEAMSRHLERQAMASTDPVVVVGTFQNAEQYNASTARRFAALAASGAVVAVLGRGIPDEPSVGIQGQNLSSHDRILKEWTIAVVTAHFAGALIARDCGDDGEDSLRRFDYVVTYDRDTVLAAAEIMLRRLDPRAVVEAGTDRPVNIVRNGQAESVRQDRQLPLLARAIASSSNGITIVDATAPDLPLVYVNSGFEAMTGYTAGEMIGRNCRFLQGPQTDRHAVDSLRELVRTGTGGQITLLNYHRDGTPWWNEVHVSPVVDSAGRLTHFIGIQNDVTARVLAEGPPVVKPKTGPVLKIINGSGSDPKAGSNRSVDSGYGKTVLHQTSADGWAITTAPGLDVAVPRAEDKAAIGLLDRVGAQAYLHAALDKLTEPGGRAGTVTLLLCSFDRSTQMPDGESDQVFDRIVLDIAGALAASVEDDVVFRNGDEEFGVISRLAGEHSVVAAYAVAGRLHRAAIEVAGPHGVTMSIGIALSPENGRDVDELWRNAEAALVLAEDSGPNATRYAADVPIPRLTPAWRGGRAVSPWPSW
jgi:PAS domain S-box-containing protein/diguanylate cyclase (GGDEF)-like protein